MGSLATALARPEYTGENRCWPCTVANGFILLCCCLVLAVLSPLLSLFVLVVGVGAITLRGYLVPRTPKLTARVRRTIDPDPGRPPVGSIATAESNGELGERVVEGLIDGGVIRPEGARLQLDETFRAAWREEMERLGALPDEGLIEAIESATHGTTVELLSADRSLIALTGPGGGEAWLSRPVAIAEVAAERALKGTTAMPDRHRLAAARALRSFLDRCPVCETRTEETSLRRCCGSPRNTDSWSSLVCPACDELLYRFPDE